MNTTEYRPVDHRTIEQTPTPDPMPARHFQWSARQLTARVHIGERYEDVAADAAERAERGFPGDRRARAAAVTSFLIAHRRNRADYAFVMGSH